MNKQENLKDSERKLCDYDCECAETDKYPPFNVTDSIYCLGYMQRVQESSVCLDDLRGKIK